jgi:hypothetical protein
VEALLARHDPRRWRRTLSYRDKRELPFDPAAVKPSSDLLLDTTVYLDALAGTLPDAIERLVATTPTRHAAPALGELALPLGLLDPTDSRSKSALEPIREALARIPLARVVAPSVDHWLEGALIVGTLTRIQGVPKVERRKFLNDTLIYLAAGEIGAILLTRNTRDFDLLMQVRPGVDVLFYERR